MAISELPRVMEAVIWTVNDDYCSAHATAASGNNIASNTLVKGPLTAMVPAVPGDTTGLYFVMYGADATSGAKRITIMDRGPAQLNGNLIQYPAGSTAPQKAAHNAALLTLGIKVKV